MEEKPINLEFKNLEYSHFTDQQKQIIESLAKFSGRASQVKLVQLYDMPQRKEIFVKEYFSFLNIDEQVDYNDMKRKFQDDYYNACLIGVATSFTGFGYYIFVTPLSQSLIKQSVKSGVLGCLVGYGYFKFRQYQYNDKLHGFYTTILNRRRR